MSRTKEGLRTLATKTWRIDGMEKRSGLPMSVLYSGPETQFDFMMERIFGDRIERNRYLGRRSLWAINRLMRRQSADLAVISGPTWILEKLGAPDDLLTPWWIESVIDAQQLSTDGPKTKSMKNDLRKVRKNELGYREAHDLEELADFYDRIYQPTVVGSHGKAALPSSYSERKKQVLDGDAELLLVVKEEEVVGGVVLDYRESPPALRDIGVVDGRQDLKSMGVITAGNYFGMMHLYKRGFDTVSMGLTRSFVDDGVFQYKRKWQPTLRHSSDSGFLLRASALGPASRSFLSGVDCVGLHAGKLVRCRFFDSSTGTTGQFGGPADIPGVSEDRWFDLRGQTPQPQVHFPAFSH